MVVKYAGSGILNRKNHYILNHYLDAGTVYEAGDVRFYCFTRDVSNKNYHIPMISIDFVHDKLKGKTASPLMVTIVTMRLTKRPAFHPFVLV